MSRRLQGRGDVLGYAGALGVILLAGVAISAASMEEATEEEPDAQYAAVCMDQRTGARLDDDACGDWDEDGIGHIPGTYYVWMPMSAGNAYIPPVGGRFTGRPPTVTRLPHGTPVSKGAPKTGGQVGAVQRGGFGVKSGTAGGSKAGAAGKAGSAGS